VSRDVGFSLRELGAWLVTVSILLGWFGGDCVADVLVMGFLLVIFWRCDGVVVLSTRYKVKVSVPCMHLGSKVSQHISLLI
jgi:hypothetical protein